jgi:hypothetical protein
MKRLVFVKRPPTKKELRESREFHEQLRKSLWLPKRKGK